MAGSVLLSSISIPKNLNAAQAWLFAASRFLGCDVFESILPTELKEGIVTDRKYGSPIASVSHRN